MLKQGVMCLLVGGSVLLVGCTSDKDERVLSSEGRVIQNSPMPLKPMDNPPVPDAPLPQGFQLVNALSRTDLYEGSRTISHIYEGRAPMHDLVAYLRVNVGKYNWERVKDEESPKKSVLQFTKGRELMTITLEQNEKYLKVTLNLVSRSLSEMGK